MKYLKKYESKVDAYQELLDNREDIIKVFMEYCNTYDDKTKNMIMDLLWDSSLAADRIEAINARGAKIDEECFRLLMVDMDSDRSNRHKHMGLSRSKNILDIYKHCKSYLGNKNNIDSIKDIFTEYSDTGKVSIYKSSDKNDDRYIIIIWIEDILLNINFHEILGRMEDMIGLSNYSYEGRYDYIKMEFWKK
jgi:hypothetical protein